MKFDIKKIIKKSLLVSFMLGSSAFMFSNVYATTSSTTSSTSSSSKVTDAEKAAVEKMTADLTEQYKAWLEANPKASDDEKTKKQQELMTKAYESLSDSDKKLVDSYLAKSSSSENNNKTSTKTSTTTKTTASSSAKTKTGDTCSVSLLGLSLLGSVFSCISFRKKN